MRIYIIPDNDRDKASTSPSVGEIWTKTGRKRKAIRILETCMHTLPPLAPNERSCVLVQYGDYSGGGIIWRRISKAVYCRDSTQFSAIMKKRGYYKVPEEDMDLILDASKIVCNALAKSKLHLKDEGSGLCLVKSRRRLPAYTYDISFTRTK